MRGDRHWATVRAHNKHPTRRSSSKGLTHAQRQASLYAISNRGANAVNPGEQKAHRTVTADLKVEIAHLWECIEDLELLLGARCDGLSEQVKSQRQTFDLAFLELHDLRDALGHALDQLQREINTRSIDTAPLKRPFLGRVLWFLRGAE